MPPVPGDPFLVPGDKSQDIPMEIEEPHTSTEAEKYAKQFMQYQDEHLRADNQELKANVIFWKNTAEKLRSSGIPLHINRRNKRKFDPKLVEESDALDKFLDELITTKGVDSELTATKCRLLISGTDSYLDFAKRMKELDFSLKCNEIWENDSVAYRCNTCAMTPCMSLCAECFLSNGHQGHDFTRFFSREGGACDCGNEDVLSSSGFCSRHGPEAMKVQRIEPPVALAEYIYLKIIVRIFLELRGIERAYEQMEPRSFTRLQNMRIHAISPSVLFLQECVNLGGPMRNAITRILTDSELYKYLTEETSEDLFNEQETNEGREEQKELCRNSLRSLFYHNVVNLDWRTKNEFQRDLLALLDKKLIEAFEDQMEDTVEYMRCDTLLHEFLFWIFRLKFPQNAINFILSMLSDTDYLNMVALRFFKWYPISANTMKILCKRVADPHNRDTASSEVGSVASRIIHVSVQMLSSSALCCRMNDECDLVSTVFRSALYLLGETLAPTECFLDPRYIYIRNCDEMPEEHRSMIKARVITADKNAVISQHGYWFVMGDIQNVMSHTQLAVRTVCSPAFKVYLKLASLMQGMNAYWRIVSGDHATHDNGEQAQRTFTMEYETLSITMFNFVVAILSEKDEQAAKRFFYGAVHALKEWIADVLLSLDEDTHDIRACPAYSFTVHLPLHRHVSIAISHFYEVPGFEPLVQVLREEKSFLRLILLHPLRIHVFRAEHHCNMWVRNGHQLRIQSMLYAQPHINQSFFQPDLDLIRFCAANISAEWFICTLIKSYHLDDFFDIEEYPPADSEAVDAMEEDEAPGHYPQREVEKFNLGQLNAAKKRIAEAEKTLKEIFEEAGITPALLSNVPELEGDDSLDALKKFMSSNNSWTMGTSETETEPVASTSDGVEKAEEAEEWSRRKELQEKLQAVKEVLKGEDVEWIRKMCLALKKLQEQKESIMSSGYNKLFLETDSMAIGTKWDDTSRILRRAEWIDPMVQNCFLLIAELLVIRVNCGATERESMRMEMVHELANGKMKYSHIRQCITDKGSRNSSNEFFADVLNEVADYHEPDEGNDNRLSQGGYTLKTELWHSDFDPVFAQMRATLPGRAQEALIKAERYDLETFPSATRPASLWIPYRLYQPGLPRHEAVKDIINILFTDRFTQLALLTIETKRSGESFLSDNTIQLMIYLLSIAAKEGGIRSEPEREIIYGRFHRVYTVQLQRGKEPYEISLFQSIYQYFMSLVIRKGIVLEQLEKVLSGSLFKERIIGGEMEYVGRLLSILQSYDFTCRFPIECDIESYKELKKEEDSKVDKESERKLAMKRKRDALLEKQRQKGAKLMEKHRENEGLSQDEVNAMDITNRQISRYECPICGDIDVPSTLQNPLGMMAVLVSNNLPDLRVHQDWTPPTLMEAIEQDITYPQQKRFWNTIEEKEIIKMNMGIYGDNIQGPAITTEIQTCGHTAHLECFQMFQQSQLDALRQDPTRGFLLSCPLCRTTIDTIIPLKIDTDFGTSDIGPVDNIIGFEEIRKCILGWERTFQDPVENTNWHNHYAQHTDSWMEKMSTHNLALRSKYDYQTNLLAIMRAAVERNIIYKELGVPERRKNGWTLPIVQLIPAAVSRTTSRNVDVCLSAIRDLFVPERAELTRSISESALPLPPPPPSGSMEELLHLTMDTARLEEISREAERSLAKKTGTVLSLQKDKKIEALLKSRSDVPLLLLDLRLLFIRISSFIVDNDKLTNNDKLALIQALAKRIVQSGGIKSSILLLHRVTPSLNNYFVNDCFRTGVDTNFDDNTACLMKYVCDWYSTSRHMLVGLQNSLSSDDDSINDPAEVFKILKENLRALDEYCQEFVFASGLVADRKEIHSYIDDFSECEEPAKHWIKWFAMELNSCITPPTSILHHIPLSWKTVTLLTPPYQYDELFSKLFKKKCLTCDKVPQTPFICMNCGQLVCFDDCCKMYNATDRGSTMEINRHADSCTGGVGIYLALNSAVVVLIRGRYGAVWGSIYLDAHGEEDRNLRRGKALFLSNARFQILQKDWAGQTFDRVNAWYVSTMLHNLVREARL